MLFAALKDKKSCHGDNEGKFSSQIIAIELYKQPKKNLKKEHLRLVISSIRLSVVSSVPEQMTAVLLVSF